MQIGNGGGGQAAQGNAVEIGGRGADHRIIGEGGEAVAVIYIGGGIFIGGELNKHFTRINAGGNLQVENLWRGIDDQIGGGRSGKGVARPVGNGGHSRGIGIGGGINGELTTINTVIGNKVSQYARIIQA